MKNSQWLLLPREQRTFLFGKKRSKPVAPSSGQEGQTARLQSIIVLCDPIEGVLDTATSTRVFPTIVMKIWGALRTQLMMTMILGLVFLHENYLSSLPAILRFVTFLPYYLKIDTIYMQK